MIDMTLIPNSTEEREEMAPIMTSVRVNSSVRNNNKELHNVNEVLSDRAKDHWCPSWRDRCHTSPVCHPCRRRYLIILATGRSGSTTLQYMMNSLPGVRMAGENNNALETLWRAIDSTRQFSHFKSKMYAWNHNPVPPSAYACTVQQFMETINPPNLDEETWQYKVPSDMTSESATIVGFKTIRFLNYRYRNARGNSSSGGRTTKDGKYDDHYNGTQLAFDGANYLQEMFPCARFVINIKSNLTSQANSLIQRFKRTQSSNYLVKELMEINDLLTQVYHFLGHEKAYWLDSSIWTKNVSAINKMVVDWLQFPSPCQFDAPFRMNTGERGWGPEAEGLGSRKNPKGCLPFPS